MSRKLVLAAVLGAFGILGMAQCCPPPSEPPCYTTFWQGEDVCFELVVPFWGWCCCCPAPQVQVTGWRVVTMDGNVIYQETFATPTAPGKWVWKQVDAQGRPVAPGFYKIVVSTTSGEYENTVKIVAKPECQCCCFPFFFFGYCGFASKPCMVSWCTPYVKLYRCPTCEASCCCGVTIYIGSNEP